MARTRLIHPEFFRHEGLGEISAAARLLFAGLWTLADREGRLEDRPRRVKADLFPYDDLEIEPLFGELVGGGFVVRYVVDGAGYIAIPAFLEWQEPHPREKASEIPEPCKGEPRSTLGAPGTPVSVSVSVSDPVSDPEDLAVGVENPTPPPTPFTAYVAAEWRDLKKPHEFERRARAAFPGIDLLVEARKARGWELSDVKRRKVKHGPFLWNWLGRSQDGASRNGASKQPVIAPMSKEFREEDKPF